MIGADHKVRLERVGVPSVLEQGHNSRQLMLAISSEHSPVWNALSPELNGMALKKGPIWADPREPSSPAARQDYFRTRDWAFGCLWRINTEPDFHTLQEQEYGAPSEDSSRPRRDEIGRSPHVDRLNQHMAPER